MLRYKSARRILGGLIVVFLLLLPFTAAFHGLNGRSGARRVPLHPPQTRKVAKKIPLEKPPAVVRKTHSPDSTVPSPLRRVEPNEFSLFVRLIHAEAGGETLQGQVAVGAVILNRINSGRFPKTIRENIFKNGEFESVSNGYIWSNPTASSYKAARLAISGWDPTRGALFFYNPAKTDSVWIWSRPIIAKIGRHFFAS